MSTIKFDHSKDSFPEALGLDDNDTMQLAKTMATMMEHAVKTGPSKSEIAELIAKTCSFTEILILATDGFKFKMHEAVDHFKEAMDDADLANEEDMDEFLKKLKAKMKDGRASVHKIEIDPSDIDGSLDRAGVPNDLRSELKARILKEMRDRLRDQEED